MAKDAVMNPQKTNTANTATDEPGALSKAWDALKGAGGDTLSNMGKPNNSPNAILNFLSPGSSQPNMTALMMAMLQNEMAKKNAKSTAGSADNVMNPQGTPVSSAPASTYGPVNNPATGGM